MLIFIQNTILLIFNFWSLDFILLPFVGFNVFFWSLFFVMFSATVFVESMKQLMSHCMIHATIFKSGCVGRLALLSYITITFYILSFFAVNFRKLIFNPWHNYWFFGLTWLPQIIKNSLLGQKDTSIMCYFVWHTCYILYIPTQLSYHN